MVKWLWCHYLCQVTLLKPGHTRRRAQNAIVLEHRLSWRHTCFVRIPTSLFRTKKYGRRPSAVVKAACLESQRSHSGLQILEKQNVSSYPTYTDSILWMPPWLRGSVLDLRPPWLEFWIQYLEAVSFHSSYHHQEVLLAQFSLYVHNGRWPKPLFISFHTQINTWMCNSAWNKDSNRSLFK